LIPAGGPGASVSAGRQQSLNFIGVSAARTLSGRENPIAIVKVPRVLPRVIRLPAKVSGGKTLFIALSSIVRAHCRACSPGRESASFQSG